MNIISMTVWTLEHNCFIVYTALIVCFVGFTIFHKNQLETHYRRLAEKKEKLAKTGTNRRVPDRDFPDDGDDDPELLVPAIPEDTPHIPFRPINRSNEELHQMSREYYELMARRRTVRSFSTEPVPEEVLENIIKTAVLKYTFVSTDYGIFLGRVPGRELYAIRPHMYKTIFLKILRTSPSGAHTEPWTFVVVQDPDVKAAIRTIVEEEEKLNYNKRMSRQWVTDLKPFATKPEKPYLSDAPALILVFRQAYSWREDGKKRMHYYNEISTAIATGFLLAAIQYCGLVSLTSTPLNCNSRLRDLLSRPVNERLELLLPVGRPHENATVPDIQRKPLQEIMVKI